jgi:hypothetical protein
MPYEPILEVWEVRESFGKVLNLTSRLSSVAVCFGEDRLVQVYVAVPDLQVEAASGIRADPSLVVHSGTLTTKVR